MNFGSDIEWYDYLLQSLIVLLSVGFGYLLNIILYKRQRKERIEDDRLRIRYEANNEMRYRVYSDIARQVDLSLDDIIFIEYKLKELEYDDMEKVKEVLLMVRKNMGEMVIRKKDIEPSNINMQWFVDNESISELYHNIHSGMMNIYVKFKEMLEKKNNDDLEEVSDKIQDVLNLRRSLIEAMRQNFDA